ncbi:hypothetical protein ABMA28_003717 [Loxostege sticticalis]|uniref:PiggyBac transposable element-derived protein domain-containing protein n=1 Tax=Loxostege sticticalis TaxID=481309 RepID=A0ABD0SST1_LOXSC
MDEECQSRGRGRGRGRPRGRSGGGRGGGRTRARGASTPRTSSEPGTSSGTARSFSEELKKIKKMRVADKRNESRLSEDQRLKLKEMRQRKEVAHFLLPDAPPKKTKKKSPERVVCPLFPGTPMVPPPRIPQPWERSKPSATVSVAPINDPVTAYRNDAPVREQTPPRASTSTLVLTPSTGVLHVDELEDTNVIVDAEIEVIGFSPASTSAASTSAADVIPLADTTEPSIFSDTLQDDIERWEDTIGVSLPGSDIEEDDAIVELGAGRSLQNEFDDLPGEVSCLLAESDDRDDRALREIATDDMLNFDWSSDPLVFTGQRETFTGQAGPTFAVGDMGPFEIFSKIWDPEVIHMIVLQTNKYAESLQGENSKLRWTPITPEELWVFFGIIMLQSLVSIAVEREYWRPCLPYLKIGNFGEIMPFRRFVAIKKCLHFVDNTRISTNIPDKLKKIQPILDHLNQKFSSLYLPAQDIAIDESLLLWKGRLSFSQLIANKAAQVGIKTYELCESSTGYLWKFNVYTGKKDATAPVEVDVGQEAEPEGATSQIVFKLVRPLLNRGHTLVMDNFYNSPLLTRSLKTKKTDTMGTLRLNREFVPGSLKGKTKSNMRTGEVAFSQTRDMTIAVWKDANVVSLISSYHKTEVGGKEKYGAYKYKPKVVLDYNLAMGGVDRKDQLLQAFPVERIRNQVWYKKLFRRLLNVSILNAAIIYGSAHNNTPQRQFRVKLADEILQRFRPPRIVAHLPPSAGHFPVRNEKRKARCKLCASKKVDTCTVWKCEACDVNLCILGCFKTFHTT